MNDLEKNCSPIDVDKKIHLNKPEQMNSWIVNMKRHGEGLAAVISGGLTFVAWMLDGGDLSSYALPLFILAYLIGGFMKAKEGVLTLLHEREFDVNLLMIFAALGAASIGYWMEGAVLIFIFALSGAMETYTLARSYRDIASLMEMKPETALLFKNGMEEEVPIERLAVGDLIIVKPGERIPADGMVREGVSTVDESPITGESIPVDKGSMDQVFAGTRNIQGSLIVEVTQTSDSTLFSKIIRLVQDAQSELPPSQQFMERFEKIYAKLVLGATLLLMIVPYYLFQWSWEQSLYRSMVFLVVASPCALVASIMPVMLSAISNSARKGVLFKGGVHLENLAEIKAIAFDKTGTLTAGQPKVTEIIPFQQMDEMELLQTAASIERLSEHPLGKAIVNRAKELGLILGHPHQLRAVTGYGIIAEFAGDTWKIGKRGFLDGGISSESTQEIIRRMEEEGKTVIYVQNSKGLAGLIAVQDTIRPEAVKTIEQLKKLGIQVVMLTGDKRTAAEAIAAKVHVDHVFAELLPEQKVELVKRLREQYGKIAMIGDGVNDAPALATATVGIAMGNAGSDVALDTADLVLMNDDLERIPITVKLGQKAKSIIKQNIVFSLAVIVLLILTNFFQILTLPIGVIGHEGSTILVILNGLRLLRS